MMNEKTSPFKTYFWEKIFPSFIPLAFGSIAALCTYYVTLATTSFRVTALEERFAKVEPVFNRVSALETKQDLTKEAVDKVSDKLDRLIEKKQ